MTDRVISWITIFQCSNNEINNKYKKKQESVEDLSKIEYTSFRVLYGS